MYVKNIIYIFANIFLGLFNDMQFSLGLCSLFQIYKNIACIVWLYPKFLGDFAARRTAFGSQFHKCLVQGEVWRIGLLNGEIPGSAWEFAGFLGILLSNIKFSGSFQFTLCILTQAVFNSPYVSWLKEDPFLVRRILQQLPSHAAWRGQTRAP